MRGIPRCWARAGAVFRRGLGREAQVDRLEIPAPALQEDGGHGAVHPTAQSDGDFTTARHEPTGLTGEKMSIFRAPASVI